MAHTQAESTRAAHAIGVMDHRGRGRYAHALFLCVRCAGLRGMAPPLSWEIESDFVNGRWRRDRDPCRAVVPAHPGEPVPLARDQGLADDSFRFKPISCRFEVTMGLRLAE